MNRMFRNPAFLLIFTGLLSCSKYGTVKPPETMNNGMIPEVSIIQPEVSDYSPVIKTFGSLAFTMKTDITAPADGKISAVYVSEGDKISKGDILMEIENLQLLIRKKQIETELQSSLAQLRLAETRLEEGRRHTETRFLSLEKTRLLTKQKELELEKTRKRFGELLNLMTIDGASRKEVENLEIALKALETEYLNLLSDYEIAGIGFRDKDLLETYGFVPKDQDEKHRLIIRLNTRTLDAERATAEAGVASSRSELESMQLLLEDLVIRASYDGIVGARYPETGENVKAGDNLLTTFRDDYVYAVFSVQENQAGFLHKGMVATVTVPALGDREFYAELSRISPVIDPQSGGLQVKALILAKETGVLPGMFFKAVIPTQIKEKQMCIPESAVFERDGSSGRIYILKKDRVFSRSVSVADSGGGMLRITEGIGSADLVVRNPPRMLRDGMEVNHEKGR